MWDHLSVCDNCRPVDITPIKELIGRLQKQVTDMTTISLEELSKPRGLKSAMEYADTPIGKKSTGVNRTQGYSFNKQIKDNN